MKHIYYKFNMDTFQNNVGKKDVKFSYNERYITKYDSDQGGNSYPYTELSCELSMIKNNSTIKIPGIDTQCSIFKKIINEHFNKSNN